MQDIRDASDWYGFKSKGSENGFKKQVVSQINTLKKNPTIFAIRYNDVRCMLIKNFPFLVHFTIDEPNGIVKIFAIFHTSRNPKIWNERN